MTLIASYIICCVYAGRDKRIDITAHKEDIDSADSHINRNGDIQAHEHILADIAQEQISQWTPIPLDIQALVSTDRQLQSHKLRQMQTLAWAHTTHMHRHKHNMGIH